jgi:hypothetical protein
MRILRACVAVPVVLVNCAAGIQKSIAGDDSGKLPGIELSRNVFFADSVPGISALIVNGGLTALVELSRDTAFHALLVDCMEYCSVFLFEVFARFPELRAMLRENGIVPVPTVEYRFLNDQLSLEDATVFGRRLAVALFQDDAEQPFRVAPEFLVRCVNIALRDCEAVAAGRRGADNKLRKVKEFPTALGEMCNMLLNLFRALTRMWRRTGAASKDVLDALKRIFVADVPFNGLAVRVHQTIHRMFVHYLRAVAPAEHFAGFEELWTRALRRDFMYVAIATEKDSAMVQVMGRYKEDKQIRRNMFEALVESVPARKVDGVLQFVVAEMLWNTLEVKCDMSAVLASQCRFPIRFEAVEMICWLLQQREKFTEFARMLIGELVSRNFVENERKMTETNDNGELVGSSIRLLKVAAQCPGISDPMISRAKDLLLSLRMRFVRPPLNLALVAESEEESSARLESAARSRTSLKSGRSGSGRPVITKVKRPSSQTVKRTTSVFK